MKLTWNGLRIKQQQNIAVTTATLIGSIIGAAVSAIGSGINTGLQASTNKQNQKNLETAWSRDDAQLQRAKADATAAGFSPLAALSNNLTNTSPGMLQAPQFDSSGIVDSITSGTKSYADAKSQEPILKQQVKGMKLENAIKSTDLRTRNLQNLANLAKSLKELDGMDLSNYEKASILVASGIPTETAQSMLKYTTKQDVVKNTSQESLTKLQDAQKELVAAQKDVADKQKSLVEMQTNLAEAQKNMSQEEKKYWFEDKQKVYIPTMNFKNGDINKPYITFEEVTTNRKDALEQLNSRLKTFEGYDYLLKFDEGFWNRINSIFGWFH